MMNIYAEEGEKVIFAYPQCGYDGDKTRAAKYLEVGKEYTVSWTEVGGFSSVVYLEEFPNVPFNTVMFESSSRQNIDDSDAVFDDWW